MILLYHGPLGVLASNKIQPGGGQGNGPDKGIGMKLQKHDEGHWPNMMGQMRAKATHILSLFSQKPSSESARPNAEDTKQSFAFSDPTTVLFPDDTDDGDAPDRPNSNLREQLRISGKSILKNQKTINSHAMQLSSDIGAREGGLVSNLANFTRFGIVVYWLYAAYRMQPLKMQGGATPFGQMTAEQVSAVFDIFITLGAIGAAGAMMGILITFISGNSSNAKLQNTAREFGKKAASIARDFDVALTKVRNAMDQHKNEYVLAIKALSQGHLTATETAAFFEFLPILNDGVDDRTERNDFFNFLKRSAPNVGEPHIIKLLVLLVGLIIGAWFGFLAGFIQFAPKPETATNLQSLLQLFPDAAGAILLPAVAYSSVGIIYDLFRTPLSLGAGVRQQALAESLDAVRAPFTGSDAPRMNDIAQRIIDALDVYIGQVRGQFGRRDHQTNHTSESSADFSEQSDETPSWRRRDTSARFVDTDFQAAPDTFRTDAYAKKIEADRAGKTGSKRGLFKLKNQPRD